MARYVAPAQLSLPAEVLFRNETENASSFIWYVDGEPVSSEKDMSFLFLHSGIYQVELEATDGKRTDRYSEKIHVEAPDSCIVWIQTNLGAMAFYLLEDTPRHRKNFLKHIENAYYDGKIFHRIIEGFMIQGGAPADGGIESGGEIPEEISKRNVHTRGALAAARMPDEINPDKKSSSTQFYIVQGRKQNRSELLDLASEKLLDYTDEQISTYLDKGGAPQLDNEYTVFGYLVFGDALIDKIASVRTDANNKPVKDIIIEEIKLLN